MAAISNLFVDQGSDFATIITVTSSDGTPLDLTNYAATSQMRKSFSSSVAYNFTATIINAVAGQLKLSLTASQSEVIPAGRWLYDVEINHTVEGYRKRIIEGIVTITPQITQGA